MRRRALRQPGSAPTAEDPNAIYRPPPLADMKDGDMFPAEVKAIYDDDPSSVQQSHLAHFPETEAGLRSNPEPGTFRIPDRVVVEEIIISSEVDVNRAVALLSKYNKYAFDLEWNTHDATNNGSPSAPMVAQIGVSPVDLMAAGSDVADGTADRWRKCTTIEKMREFATAAGFPKANVVGDRPEIHVDNQMPTYYSTDVAKVPVAMLALTEKFYVVIFRFGAAANGDVGGGPADVHPVMPASLAEFLGSKRIVIGVNQAADLTRLEAQYTNVRRQAESGFMLDMQLPSFHGGEHKKGLANLADHIANLKVFKPSTRCVDWSTAGSLQQTWSDYAANDVVLPLLLFLYKLVENQDVFGGRSGLLQAYFKDVTHCTMPEWTYNMLKKDWNHVYRSIGDCINNEHLMKSTFMYYLSCVMREKDEDSVLAELQRQRDTGKYTEEQLLNMRFRSADMRVAQYAPPKEVMLERFEKVWGVFGAAPPTTTGITFAKDGRLQKKVVQLRIDIERDRFSDPPDESMYTRRPVKHLISFPPRCTTVPYLT